MTDPSQPEGAPSGSAPRGLAHHATRVPTPAIFAISVLVAAAILWRSGSIGDVSAAIRRADVPTIIAGMLLYLAGLALLCLRWDVLVRMVKGRSHPSRSSEAFLTSVVINYAAPIGLAVPSRAALTKRALGLDAAETGAIALWEVGVDVLVLAAGSALWLLLGGWNADFLPETTRGQQAAGLAIALAGIALAAAAGALLARRRPAIWAKVTLVTRTVATYPARRPAMAALVVGVTVVYWIVQGAVLWLLLDALAVAREPLLVLGLTTLPILVGMLSPVPGGAGIREALMLGVARVYDADAAAVLLAALTYRIALFASIPVLYAGVRIWIGMEQRSDQATGPADPASPRSGGEHQA